VSLWIESDKNWFGSRREKQKRSMPEKSYSIPEVAELLSVSRGVIYKWLSLDEPEEAVIPPSAWYRLPNGRVRIYAWIVINLQARH